MKKLISIILILIGLNSNAQEIMTDWKEMDGKTKLKEYIENQAYDYLNFKPAKKDTLNNDVIKILKGSADTNVVIRCKSSIPDIPFIVINDYPIDNVEIWNSIKLEIVNEITILKPNEQTFAIYGTRGKNGLILVKINKRLWKKIKRKYGR